MDDLTLLKDMADRTPLPSADDLAPARARLLAAMTQSDGASIERAQLNGASVKPARLDTATGAPARLDTAAGTPARLDSTVGTPARLDTAARPALLISGLAAAGLAAAITGVVALGALEPVGVAPAKASAADILHEAAATMRTLPSTPPRPDQFIYTKSQSSSGTFGESWLSADGTHDGLVVQGDVRDVIPGCRDGKAQAYKGSEPMPGVFDSCTPVPAYRTDLPTDVAGMREYLNQNPQSAGKEIMYLVDGAYVPPASMAAIFEVMADFPGLTVNENAKDGAGRPGMGVTWTGPGGGEPLTIVFDKQTRAYLGMSGYTAVVEQAIVDQPGQLP
ncbi:CU044_5270 family protein [Actinophytocola sp.]|uniref:CU044_5270 family protein n=1 Tax=Actinophytocola sp. TaxID=1872138 RepID=UPI002ED0460A